MRVGRIFGMVFVGFLLAGTFSGACGASTWQGGVLEVSALVIDDQGSVVNEIDADVSMAWIPLPSGRTFVTFNARLSSKEGVEYLSGYALVRDVNGDPNTKDIDLTLLGDTNTQVDITAFLAEIVDSLQNPTIGSLLSIIYDLVRTYITEGCSLADVEFVSGDVVGGYETVLEDVVIGDSSIGITAFLAEIVD